MGKKKEIDGWVDGRMFGEKILNPKFTAERQSKQKTTASRLTKNLNDKLNYLRNNQDINKKWSLLWKWRNIPFLHWRIGFFRVQSFLRKEGFSVMQESFEDAAHMDRAHYISPEDFCIFADLSTMESKFPLEKEYDRNQLESYNVVHELFSDDIEELKDKAPFSMPKDWEHDLETIKTDRWTGSRVIYLRVDLTHYDKTIPRAVNEYIRTRMDELGLESQTNINEKSLEMALMLDDMKSIGFTTYDLEAVIDATNPEVDSTSFVKNKKDLSRKIRINCTKANFPF